MRKILKANMKIVFRDVAWIVVTFLFLIAENYICIKSLYRVETPPPMGNFYELQSVLSTSFYIYIYFLFTSFYLASKTKHTNVIFSVECIPNSLQKLIGTQLLILILIATLVTTVLIGYVICSVVKSDTLQVEIIVGMIISIIGYIWAPTVCAILSGSTIGICVNRAFGYVIVVLWSVLVSPLMQYLVEGFYFSLNINIFPAFEFLCLMPRNLNTTPNHMIGYPVTLERWLAISVGFLIPLIILVLKMNKGIKRMLKACILIGALMLSIFGYNLPMQRTVSDRNPKSAYVEELSYYCLNGGHEQLSELADFKVTKYEMKLEVNRQLKAQVVMKVDVGDLDEYHFTLYHSYKMNNVYDQDYNALSFEQNGDYVIVRSNGVNISSITMIYSGTNATYYANSSGISLPGHFAYYPRSGFHEMYDKSTQGYIPNLLEEPTEFVLEVSSDKMIFCNLSDMGENSFAGTTDGVTILGGYLASESYMDIQIIYPYMDSEQFYGNQEFTDIENFLRNKKDDETITKIMILPFKHSRNVQCVYYSDGTIVCTQPRTIQDYYEQSRYRIEKRELYVLKESYIKVDDFRNRLEYEDTVFKDDYKGKAQMLQIAVEKMGEEKVLEKIEEYLNDQSNTENVRDFLEGLLNE